MNETNFAKLAETYRAELRRNIDAHPGDYMNAITLDAAGRDALAQKIGDRVLTSVEKNGIRHVLINESPSWRGTCKALGIKHTYKAIEAYLLG